MEELDRAGIKYHRGLVPDVHFHYIFERLAALTFPLWFIFLFFRYRPAVIHSHTEMPDLATYAFFKLFPPLLRRCKVERTIHNTRLWTGLERTGRCVEAFFIKNNSNVAISPSVLDSYAKKYGCRPPIIYNGVAPSAQRPFKGLPNEVKNILFAGRFEPQKGIDVLAETIRSMAGDDRYHFHVVGDGGLRGFVEERLTGLRNVTLYPPVHGLSSYLSSFDYLFMPSVFEGFSLLSLEASMAGLPVIGSGCSGLGDTLPADWPLNVRDNSADGYARLFREVIPRADRDRLGTVAREFATANFGIRQMQEGYEKIYGRLV